MKNPWLAWYPGDYISKTRYLTMAQHGAYLLLLWEYYINGPIPIDPIQHVLNICSAHDPGNQTDVEFVLSHFFTRKCGKYRHKRADSEIAKREDVRGKRVKAGKARQHMLSTCSAYAQHMHPQSQSQPQPQEEEEKITPMEQVLPSFPLDFDQSKVEQYVSGDLDVPKLFQYFCERTNKSRAYTLTTKRRLMAERRWEEALKITNGDKSAAKVLLRDAIDALADSEYHRKNDYLDWDQIFRSVENFTKWIDKAEHPPQETQHVH